MLDNPLQRCAVPYNRLAFHEFVSVFFGTAAATAPSAEQGDRAVALRSGERWVAADGMGQGRRGREARRVTEEICPLAPVVLFLFLSCY
jgi:hypothetical protein